MVRRLSLLAGVVLFAFGTAARAQTADDIVEKYIAALGGRQTLSAVRTLRVTKNVRQNRLEMIVTETTARPAAYRRDVEQKGAGLLYSQGLEGSTGWMMTLFDVTPPDKMLPDDLRGLRMAAESARIDPPLLNYKERGISVEYVGRDAVGDTPALKLKVTPKDGAESMWFLDAATFLPLRIESATVFTTYSDYRRVDGLMLPMKAESGYIGKAPSEPVTITKIEVNPQIDPSIFAMPATAAR